MLVPAAECGGGELEGDREEEHLQSWTQGTGEGAGPHLTHLHT